MSVKRFENLNIKILSLLMAVLLEVYFYSPDNSVTLPLSASLDVLNIPSDLIITSPEHSDAGIPVRIDVRGPRPIMEQIRGATYHFTVNYPSERTLEFHPALDLKQLWLPVGVEIIGVSPSDLKIQFEPTLTKEVPILLSYSGKAKEGFLVRSVKATPESIRITGSKRRLDAITEIRSPKIDVNDLESSRDFEEQLLLPEGVTEVSASTVKVHIDVMKVDYQQSFEPVNISLVAPYGFAGTVEPSRARVTLAGEQTLISALSAKSLEVHADARGLEEGTHQLSLKGKFPEGIFLLSSEPELVQVKLRKKGGVESDGGSNGGASGSSSAGTKGTGK